jgi:hypothetical protein
MKTIQIQTWTAALIIGLALTFSGCVNPLNPPDSVTPIPSGMGAVTVTTDEMTAARTIMPSASGLYYTYLFTGTDPVAAEAPKTAEGGQFILEAGKYRVRVLAYTDAGKTMQAAEGTSEEFTVSAGANTSVSVAMEAVVSEGTGTFSYLVSYPNTLTVTPEISLVRIAGDAVTMSSPTSGTGTGVKTYTAVTDNIPAGYYTFMVSQLYPHVNPNH